MLATWGTSTGFNPASLFSGGVQGAWYDPSDNLTMFQDAAGTTPVTAVEQAVGLILDKRNGLGIGTEVISNNTFDSDTVWTKGTGWSIGSGVATKVAGSAANLSQTVTLVAGTTYRLVYTITRTAGSITPQFTGGTTVSGTARSAAGTYVENITAVTGNTDFQFAADASFAGTVDNVYLKRVSGNDAYQTTSASRPTLRARYNLLTYSEEFDNAAWTAFTTTVSANATTAPDGTLTAEQLTAAGNFPRMIQNPTLANSTNYVGSVYLKQGTAYVAGLQFINKDNVTVSALFNLSLGTLVSGAGTITSVGDGWYRCSVSFNSGSGATTPELRFVQNGQGQTGGWTGTNTIFAWGAQLIPTAVFPSNVYQRIAAATDYATGAAFPQYLAFDGTDDSLLTANVDFATVTSDGQARRNLLLNPTQFDAAGWSVTRTTVTANATTAPDNTSTADKLVEDSNAGTHELRSGTVATTAVATTFSCYAKAAERNWLILWDNTALVGKYFDVQNGVIGGNYIGAPANATIENVGGGWYRCSITYTPTGSSTNRIYLANADGGASYTGDGTSGLFIWGAQVETGSTATAFQNIGTDKMTVFSGLSKLSDAAGGTVIKTAPETATFGYVLLRAPRTASATYGLFSVGTLSADNASATSFAAPITNVVTAICDIANDLCDLRINTVLDTDRDDQGTGNYGNYAMYIGRVSSGSIPFNGRVYSLIVRGAASNSTQIEQTERYVASKTPLGVVP